MSQVSDVRHIKRSRKRHVCDWCNETIEAGSAYTSWFTFYESVVSRMHPECYEAHLKIIEPGEELPTRGDYRRGCWCEERPEHCRCVTEDKA